MDTYRSWNGELDIIVQKYNSVLTELLPAERVSAVLATRVPRLPRRLAALHFLATRSAVAAELRGSLALVRSAAEEVLGATRLRAVLARVLAERAQELSLDNTVDSPFAILAKDNDIMW